ncbi:MAG: LytTR family transcriptional regulator DNA-binding domain-containing protein [Lachnospiraceae bacterium]|nr:LytTR family transcriptional regulator DNA-binding domain-containing protein [Lachnospiraceae bacterium]
MISGIIFDSDTDERTLLSQYVRNGIAIKSDDESMIVECKDVTEFSTTVKDADLNDFCCMDFRQETGRENAGMYRAGFPDGALLLMVDVSVSPREYVRPDIMPSAILIRPLDEENLTQTIDDFLEAALGITESGTDESISIDTREGVTRIPFDRISYIEASTKKVYIRTRKEEYGYYDTLDNLEAALPESFARCHRSYIVNLKKVTRYVGSESMLYLDDGSMLPVSRSYKSGIREVLK